MPDHLDTLPTCWYCPECGGVDSLPFGFIHTSGYANACTTEPVKVPILPPDAALDPVRLRAILELVGLEVREGWLQPEGFADCVTFVGPPFPVGEPVLVCRVRPQGEASHAGS